MAGSYTPFSGVSKRYRPSFKKTDILTIALIATVCFIFYVMGSWTHAPLGPTITSSSSVLPCPPYKDQIATALDFSAHHTTNVSLGPTAPDYSACHVRLSEYTPCEDRDRSLKYARERLVYRERHCPEKGELLKCLVPAPYGYKRPFAWPESREFAWLANVPHRELSVEKAVQNWIRVEGDRFRFPGGGTMFPRGADAYIDEIGKLVSLTDGSIRTAVDTGCGVASWGAYLLSRNITTMSFAPRDTHEAQVQFALERGVPAMIGILASNRLPYPSRAFDMAHCSRCLIPWHLYDGLYLIEVDRILRPGAYWILSGPPINWKSHWKGWQRTEEDLSNEQSAIEAVARSLCWKKLKEKGDISIWQKPNNHVHCKMYRNAFKKPQFCTDQDPDTAWYTKMEACITPLPELTTIQETAGGDLKRWPERLTAVPPRISSGSLEGITPDMFIQDTELWRRRLVHYKDVVNQLGQSSQYRNLLDMNSRLGGFAAALADDPVWVMNIVPTISELNTLGVIYERGLIGTYQDWCEAMSTYPRTYDLLHADSVFSLYQDRCEMEDILLEMDRILRPEGTVIFRDDVDILVKIKKTTDRMKWDSQIVDHEDGPKKRDKLLVAVKMYWTAPDQNQEKPNKSQL